MEEKNSAKGSSINWLIKSAGYSVACFHEHPGCVLNSVATRHSYSKIWRALSPTRTTRSILPVALRCSVLAYTAKVHSSRRTAGCSQPSTTGSRPRRRGGPAGGEQAPAGGDPPGIAEAEPASAAADEAAADPELEHPPPADSEQPDLVDANRADPALDAALLEEGVPADEGVVREEGAALGAPGEADAAINLAQEEEAPEQDEYVEVEVDSETLSIYEPLPPSGDEADVLAEEPSSSALVGSGSLSSRTPLVLRPRQPGYPPVRIDREGTWAKIGGPLAQPEPVQPPAPGPAYPTFPREQTRLGLILRLLPAPTALLGSVWGSRITILRLHPRVLPRRTGCKAQDSISAS